MSLSSAIASDRSRTVLPTSWLRMSRLDNRAGQEARLACEILIECQYKRGRRNVGRYSVWLERGQCLTTYERARDVMGVGKRQTARRALSRICAELGWTCEPVTTAHPVCNEYPPWDNKGGDRGDNKGGDKGAHIGTLITACNYDSLTSFGGEVGDNRGDHKGTAEGTTASTPYGPTSYAGDPIQESIQESIQEEPLSSSAKPKPDVMAQVREVFDHWKSTLNHPKTKLGSDRVIKIRSRLREGFTVEELKQAIDGCAASPHHMGDNDRGPDGNGKVFDSIGLIFAGSDSVDRFKGYMNTKPRKQDFKPTPGVYRNAQMDPAMKARIEAQKKAQREAGNDPS